MRHSESNPYFPSQWQSCIYCNNEISSSVATTERNQCIYSRLGQCFKLCEILLNATSPGWIKCFHKMAALWHGAQRHIGLLGPGSDRCYFQARPIDALHYNGAALFSRTVFGPLRRSKKRRMRIKLYKRLVFMIHAVGVAKYCEWSSLIRVCVCSSVGPHTLQYTGQHASWWHIGNSDTVMWDKQAIVKNVSH